MGRGVRIFSRVFKMCPLIFSIKSSSPPHRTNPRQSSPRTLFEVCQKPAIFIIKFKPLSQLCWVSYMNLFSSSQSIPGQILGQVTLFHIYHYYIHLRPTLSLKGPSTCIEKFLLTDTVVGLHWICPNHLNHSFFLFHLYQFYRTLVSCYTHLLLLWSNCSLAKISLHSCWYARSQNIPEVTLHSNHPTLILYLTSALNYFSLQPVVVHHL